MTRTRSSILLAAAALAESAPLAGALGPGGAGSAAASGDLVNSLRTTGLAPDLCRLAAAWPAALRPALARLDRLPPTEAIWAPLLQFMAYFMGIATLQLGFGAFAFAHLVRDFGAVGADLGTDLGATPASAGALFLGWLVPLGAAGAIAAGRSPRFPGWGRHLARAREAAFLAALAATHAPESVRAEWARGCRWIAGGGTEAADPDALAFSEAARAVDAHGKFVATIRGLGLGALTLVALAITLSVYGAVGQLSIAVGAP